MPHSSPGALKRVLLLKRRPVQQVQPAFGMRGFGMAEVPTPLAVQVEVQDVSPKDLADMQRDSDVEIAVEEMPLELIKPFDSANPNAVEGPGPVWGIEAIKASSSPFTGQGVIIAVLDTGIDKTHAAFTGVQIEGKNFTDGDPADFNDVNGHGTHCAGTIFGRDVDGKRIGVARGIEKVLIGKVLGPGGGSTATLLDSINWAVQNKAQIISMSLGMDLVGLRERLVQQGVHPKAATSDAMRILINNVRFFDKFGGMLRSGAAFGRSALVIAATGNESQRVGESTYTLGAAFPAETEDFLSVGAVERTDDPDQPYRIAEFSNAGAKLAAPGVDILSAAPGGGLVLKSGTSMATPHIAGLAALWVQKLKSKPGQISADKIMQSLRSSAKLTDGLDEADVGDGIPQAPQK